MVRSMPQLPALLAAPPPVMPGRLPGHNSMQVLRSAYAPPAMTCRSSKDTPTASRRVTTDAWLRVPAGAHEHRRSTGVRPLRAILFSAVRDVFNDLSVLGGSSSTVLKRSPRSQPRSSHLSSRVVPPSQFRAAPSIAIRPCFPGRRSIGNVRYKCFVRGRSFCSPPSKFDANPSWTSAIAVRGFSGRKFCDAE